ncbi:MAG TPA: MCE family protein, partial [Flavobacteriaceae bacterium]|nr:MCE family protein [Flavobacteriaceae bacterium]
VQGLTTSSIVTINGFQVGNVTNIKFNPEKKGNLIVAFSLSNDISFSKNSTTKITPGLMGGAELSIIPSYDGEESVSGDYLIGSADLGMISSLAEKISPIENKLTATLSGADDLLKNLNQVLDKKTQQNLRESIVNLNATLKHFKGVSKSMEEMLASNKAKFSVIMDNTSAATNSLKTMTSDFEQAKMATSIKETISKLNTSLANVDVLLSNFNKISTDMSNGKGSIGKLLNDDGLYNNLENASKEMEELMREMKEHPKRFVHFSLFGKKAKEYKKEETNK